MDYLKLVLIHILFLCLGCNSDQPKEHITPNTNETSIDQPKTPIDEPQVPTLVIQPKQNTFTTQPQEGLIYKGTVGDIPIQMHLSMVYKVSGDPVTEVMASYSYDSQVGFISLSGTLSDGGRLRLSSAKEVFRGAVDQAGIFEGTWTKGEKKLDFKLSPICNKIPDIDNSVEEFLSNFTLLDLPFNTEEIDGCWGCNDLEHLFAVDLMNCPMNLKSLVNLNLIDEEYITDFDDYTAHYGAYFINKLGNYVLLYTSGVDPDFYELTAAIFSKEGRLLDHKTVADMAQGMDDTYNFYLKIEKNEILSITSIGADRPYYSEEEDAYDGYTWESDPILFDLSGNSVLSE